MAFDIGAGLTEMGKSVAQTAQAYTLEAQKADLEKEKVILADQLAGVRDEKQRGFLSSERVETQKFTGVENDKNRANTLAVANIGLEGHRISAGATVAAAQIGASERRYSTDKQLEMHKYTVDEQIKAGITGASRLQIGDGGEAYSVNPITKEVTPLKGTDGTQLKFRDPDVAKAQADLIKTKTDQLTGVNRIYVPQILELEDNVTKLTKDPILNMTEHGKKQIADLNARLKTLREQFDSERAPLVRDLNAYGEALITKGKLTGAGAGTGMPDPAAFDRRLKSPTAAAPTGQVTPPRSLKMPGLINNPTIDGNY